MEGLPALHALHVLSEMKLASWTVVICLSASLVGCQKASNEQAIPSLPNRNRIDAASAILQLEGIKFTEEEFVAFDRSAKVTQALLTAKEAPPLIQILRLDDSVTQVPYTEIESRVRKGDVVQAGQNHSNYVEIMTRDGRLLASTQPKIDTIYKLCEEVDPKGVFIKIWTE